MWINSYVRAGCKVAFPEYTGERIYMKPIIIGDMLPKELSRWQPTVDAMLHGIDGKIAHLMVDQSVVAPGQTHRRGGLHVDGNWLPDLRAHGSGPGGHGHTVPSPRPSKKRPDSDKNKGAHEHPTRHSHDSYQRELIILASDVTACRAFFGQFHDAPGPDGDCSHFDVSGTREVCMEANRTYVGNVTMVHESLPLTRGGPRTVVRLNVPY